MNRVARKGYKYNCCGKNYKAESDFIIVVAAALVAHFNHRAQEPKISFIICQSAY